jgi:hypothetical protein
LQDKFQFYLTTLAYLEAAEKICAEFEARGFSTPDQENLTGLLDKIVAIIQESVERTPSAPCQPDGWTDDLQNQA